MSILTVLSANTDQETAIKIFLDALHVPYRLTADVADETSYLSSSTAMKAHLDEAATQEKNGEGVSVTLDDIWK